ncbi:hypothetical protein GWG67_37520 [Bradyrhizobium sp. CSS354]|nr:hypothetical protein [Bradyrhizobium sp. CSS354]
MTNLRFVLLATTALTAMQFASSASHAQSAPPLVVAQAQPQETGPRQRRAPHYRRAGVDLASRSPGVVQGSRPIA